MQEIANNEFYSIKIDKAKNRVYLTITGFWKEATQVPEFLNDMKKVAKILSHGLTVITDLSKMKPPSNEIAALHVEAQKILVDAGLSKTAAIHPESMIAKMSAERFSKESGMIRGMFSSKEEAEKWLDSKE